VNNWIGANAMPFVFGDEIHQAKGSPQKRFILDGDAFARVPTFQKMAD
jgi:hypothetical protein